MVDLSIAVAAGFRAFGEPARWRPATGPDQDITIIVNRPTGDAQLGGMVVSSPALTADVLASEVPAPRKGDALTSAADGKTYTVAARPERDRAGHAWRLTLGEA